MEQRSENQNVFEGVNKCMFMGPVEKVSPINFTQNQTPVVNFTLKIGKQWIKCVAWKKQAELVEKLLPGTVLWVEGRMQTRGWEDRQGQKKTTTEIVASFVTVMANESLSQAPQAAIQAQPILRGGVQPQEQPAFTEDDIPF